MGAGVDLQNDVLSTAVLPDLAKRISSPLERTIVPGAAQEEKNWCEIPAVLFNHYSAVNQSTRQKRKAAMTYIQCGLLRYKCPALSTVSSLCGFLCSIKALNQPGQNVRFSSFLEMLYSQKRLAAINLL